MLKLIQNEYKKYLVYQLNQMGWNSRQLAPFFNVSHQTICNWIKFVERNDAKI